MTNHALQLSGQQLQKGDFDRAEETLRGLLREEAGNMQGWCLLGHIRQARGRPSRKEDSVFVGKGTA
ncbi:MAG: tetratricopeptide repeat protein [Gemmataceae bacterium]